jgi:peptidoglycan/xylan/chitin deacetylase (PgdA/CDA1 family)
MPMRIYRRARRKLQPGPLILGYHRIASADWDPQHLSICPKNFAEQLEILKCAARATTIKDVAKTIRNGRALDTAFVVTFDDGYADTLTEALPLIERYGVPASVFVTTDIIGKPFWWCEIEHWIKRAESLPASISIAAGQQAFRWRKISDARKERARLLQGLGDFFRALPSSLHDAALGEVRGALGGDLVGESHIRAMTAGQVEQLSKSKLIQVGSHLVTHTPMDRLVVDEQRRELDESKRVLEEITGGVVDSFAYPNSIVTKKAPSLARKLGYRAGVAGQADTVRPGCNPYLLPRVWPGDWDGDRFARWLREWI